MNPEIKMLLPKKLVGKSLKMSLDNDQTPQLWRSLMVRRKEIKNNVSSDLISLQVYDPILSLADFTPQTIFEKWAAVEVSNFDSVPPEMKSFELQGGWYAVFIHRGDPSTFPGTLQYIFMQWLPSSNYQLDDRPHFEVLGEKYKRDSADSEEEVWIPIKEKS